MFTLVGSPTETRRVPVWAICIDGGRNGRTVIFFSLEENATKNFKEYEERGLHPTGTLNYVFGGFDGDVMLDKP